MTLVFLGIWPLAGDTQAQHLELGGSKSGGLGAGWPSALLCRGPWTSGLY